MTAGSPDFVYQSGQDAPLRDGRTYQLRGTKTENGCHYEYPALTLQDGETTRIQRDVAIDQKRCIKLVEEGTPTVEAAAEPDPSVSSVTADVDGGGSSLDVEAPVTAASTVDAVTAGHSGFTKIWWVDRPGYLVNGDTTYISWITNGSCVTQGNASGEWTWRSGTGWQLIDKGGSGNLQCARYRGETWSNFKNSTFCPFLPTVYTHYYYVRAYGWANGSPLFTGTWSSDSVDECLPLYERHQVSQTG